MKKWLCLVLSALLLVSALALAEGDRSFTSETTEQRLAQMLPVLDSLARAMGVSTAGEEYGFSVPYDPGDAALVWEQLRLMSVNWLAKDMEDPMASRLSIPADVLKACAAASFNGLSELPEIPDYGRIAFDAARGDYVIPIYDRDAGEVVIERYAADGDALVVNCGVYAREDERPAARLGGLTARMEGADDLAMYPFVVVEAHAEAPSDFAGLAPVRCDLRNLPDEAAETAPEQDEGYRTLSRGSRGKSVRRLQERLRELGYPCGPADGVFGSGTFRAVRYFQEAVGRSQSGVATPGLQSKLFAANAPRFQTYVNLQRGSEGIRVERLQARLRELGYTAMPVDGDFGQRTQDAVRRFQSASGLKEDGIAGVRTLKALEAKDARRCEGYIDLWKGDTGSRVAEMQARLIELGLLKGKASGAYDSATVEAVRAYLRAAGLEGDGKRIDASAVESMFRPMPTTEPTATPEPEPTATPEPEPTTTPEPEPTATPEPEPTATPEPEPTATPEPEPTDTPEPENPDTPAEG